MLRLISPSNLLEICRYFRPDPEGLDLPLESSSRVQIRYAGPIELARRQPAAICCWHHGFESGGCSCIQSWRAAPAARPWNPTRNLLAPEYHLAPSQDCVTRYRMWKPNDPDRSGASSTMPNDSAKVSISPRPGECRQSGMCNLISCDGSIRQLGRLRHHGFTFGKTDSVLQNDQYHLSQDRVQQPLYYHLR